MKTKMKIKLAHRILSPVFALLTLGACVSEANGHVIVVSTTIQAAVNAASPGDTIRVPPGTYYENVEINKNNIRIEGSPGAILDGAGPGVAGGTGILVTPTNPNSRINGFTLSGLQIQNYGTNGVLLQHVDNFHLRQGTYINNHVYGIYPVFSSSGLFELNQVSGANDTEIYIGLSDNVVIANNRGTDSTVGITVEDSSHVVVRQNTVTGNSIGILIDVAPFRNLTVNTDINVTDNFVDRNNRSNPETDLSDILGQLSSGIGIANIGSDHVIVKDNIVTRNNSAGILVAQFPQSIAVLDSRINPFPDNNEIRDNVAVQNGRHPGSKLAPFPGSDLLWDSSGSGNCWAHNIFRNSFPVKLPACQSAGSNKDPNKG